MEPPVPPIAKAIAAPTSSAITDASTIGQMFECSGPIALPQLAQYRAFGATGCWHLGHNCLGGRAGGAGS